MRKKGFTSLDEFLTSQLFKLLRVPVITSECPLSPSLVLPLNGDVPRLSDRPVQARAVARGRSLVYTGSGAPPTGCLRTHFVPGYRTPGVVFC
ncbi:hypothetical protein NDU88_006079 [Pleurodeles waltl]|uniref:Uncharacterized protein n=1 Tax=Pleurodeles waltl TaxID=8319 RepID=A0AAV7PHA5_PLEWA|nr:hypothetical protein NDU88_006079 [Pleurodeles waltl]